MALHDITKLAGSPPLLWSNVKDAFDKINQNFVTLAAASGSGELVDFNLLDTNVSPVIAGEYNLGSPSHTWGELHVSEYLDVPGSASNGVWLGDSHIKGYDGIIDLPNNSKVGGELIIDPSRVGFRKVSVTGQSDVTANGLDSTLTLQTADGVHITTDPISDIITFQNTGVTSIQGTNGQIGVNRSTGSVTLTNLGVTALSGGSPISGRAAGTGISVSASTGNISITNTGVIEIQAGTGIIVSTDSITGIVTVTNSAPATLAASFSNIIVSGQSNIEADIAGDSLTVEAGYGIVLTTDTLTDTLTIEVDDSILGGGNANLGDLEVDETTILTDIGQEIVIQTSYQKTITATAGAGSNMTMIVVDTSENDDIVEVAGAGGWEVDLNSGGDTPYWKEFTAAAITGENSFSIVFTGLSGEDYDYPITEGTTYTFRKIQEDTNQWIFTPQGTLATPAGGVIAEGVVTENPTIELTPANPDVASQKLIIKGGNAFSVERNGIALGINNNVWAVGDTITIYVYSFDNRGQTLSWWIYPEVVQGVISDPGTGTVVLDEQGGYGEFSFELDSDDYEFTVRVSPNGVYDDNNGVETVTINGGAGTPDIHHLHLTTGDLEETSIFLGTDDHNVRTRISGGVEITARDYDNEVSKRWQFNKDGELILPEDVGGTAWASLNGPDPNENGDTEYRAVAVDPGGAIYVGGRRDGYPTITKIEADGDIAYSKVITVAGEGPISGRVNSIEYVELEGSLLLVTLEIYQSYTNSVIIGIDTATGELAGSFATIFSQVDQDFYITETAITGNNLVAAGSKNGSFVDYPVTAETGSSTGTIVINKSDLPVGTVLASGNSAYQISGTGFATPETFSNVNFYTGISGITQEGNGAIFVIQDNGNGTYGGSISATGGNYLPGHKILIPGTSLGGTTPTNDAVLEVTIINESGGVTGVNITGTAAGAELIEYTGLTGTNYEVGSGLIVNVLVSPQDGYYSITDITYAGANYVINDVITVPGTAFLNGTSPANDLTMTALNVNAGSIITIGGEGIGDTTQLKIETPTPVDFTAEGTWNISISYARENFLSTFVGQSIFFGLGNIDEDDRLFAVVADGDDIYAIGESYVDFEETSFNAAVIYKFSLDPESNIFSLGWARVLNDFSGDHEGKSLAVASDGVYATMAGYGEGTYTGLVKLDKTTGDILWKKGTVSGDDSSVVVDPDTGLVVMAVEGGFYDVVDDDAIKLIIFGSDGTVYDRRWLARTGDDLFFKNGRCLRIAGDHIVVVGYSQTSNYNTPFIFRVPLGEQEVGFTQGDFLLHNQGDYDVFDLEGEFSYTVSPQIYEDSSVQPGPVTPEEMFYEDFDDSRTVESFGGATSAIVFSDGTRMETAPVQEKGIPQNNRGYNDYTLTLADNGKHIYHPGDGYFVYIPSNEELALPIGYTVTLITKADGNGFLNIETQTYTDINNNEYYDTIVGVGVGDFSRYWSMPERSIATLIKVESNLWYLSGPGIQNTD